VFASRDHRISRDRYSGVLAGGGSGVTTMGSNRANPGAPNPNGPNGGPRAQAVEQKHWPGPQICHNVVFWPSEFCKISPQSPGNGISESLDSKIFQVSMPWTPRKLVHIRCSTRVFGTWKGGPSKILNRGPPDITLRHWGGGGDPRLPQLAILGGRKNEKGAQKWKGCADPAPNFESGWEKTHLKKYSYFHREKMCY
jgi:hypothetical protein